VIGIYRSFGRSARIAARVLRTLLEPVPCHELTAASAHRAAAGRVDGSPTVVPPEELSLAVDLSPLPHPQTREIADRAGVPLITRPLPALPPSDATSSEAVDRGTQAGRSLSLYRGTTRPTGVRPVAARGDAGAPATRSR
jgi:hypothetical protein